MIALERIGTLTVAAASGIVVDGERIYVVGDDELTLLVADATGREVSRVALLPGTLPADKERRKHEKPDFETLFMAPDRTLVALGSGSAPNRCRIARVRTADSHVTLGDAEPLYRALEHEVDALNIEGAVLMDDALLVFQRGNGVATDNAIFHLDVRAATEARWTPDLLKRVVHVDLGSYRGVPWTFTDASRYDGAHIAATCAAEKTTSPYHDGECVGSAIAMLDANGKVSWIELVDTALKIEGIHVGGTRALLVADADDPNVLSPLYRADLSVH